MAATVQTKTGDLVADMNTTPLIDVMLVMLTLLIITLPMQTHAVKIDLPRQAPPSTIKPEIVTLAIDFDGVASWNGQTISRATLNTYLFEAARRTPQPREPLADERQLRPVHDLVDEQEVADEERPLHAAAGNLERLDEERLDAEEQHDGDREDLRPVPEEAQSGAAAIDVLQRLEPALGGDQTLQRRLYRLR